MNHKDIDFKVIMLVVNHYWLVKERIESSENWAILLVPNGYALVV